MCSTRRQDTPSEEGTQTVAVKLLQDLRNPPCLQTNTLTSGKSRPDLFVHLPPSSLV